MPTVLLHGGLGNQLFQYAVGRALSVRTESTLRLATSWFSARTPSSTPRRLHLHEFRPRGEFRRGPSREDTTLKARFKLFGLLRSFGESLALRICRVHKDQTPHRFDPQVLEAPGDSVLYGYYQTEQYFAGIRGLLREEISRSTELTEASRPWKRRAEQTNSVAVHVRRGDYVDQGWALPAEYYRSAISTVQSLPEKIDLFFFSDDVAWVREHIGDLLPTHGPAPTVHFVDCNDGTAVANDLDLMRRCRHQIIANSTLRWWGAWLNRHDEKTVLAPSYWIHDPMEDTDIIPGRWETVGWRSLPGPTNAPSPNGPSPA